MASRFIEATRQRLKLRMAIDGPSGSGKSVTALRFAHALAAGGRIFAINSEAGGLQLYTGEKFDDDGPFHFANARLTSFSPTEYTSAIEEAGREGATVIIVDSLSHAWEGADGALEQVSKKGGNSYTAWKDVTPQHRRMIDAIIQSPAHVICTMRSKTEYVLEDIDGKKVPRKLAMAPIQRQGMEYEFDIYGSMDWSHVMTVGKSRCRSVDGRITVKPGGRFMQPIIEWLEGGTNLAQAASDLSPPVRRATEKQIAEIAYRSAELGTPVGSDKFKKDIVKRFSVQEPADLLPQQAEELLARLRQQCEKKNVGQLAQAAAASPAATASPAAVDVSQPQASQPQAQANGHATDAQVTAMKSWLGELGTRGFTADHWKSLLGKYGVASGKELTSAKADEVINRLRDLAVKERQAAGEVPLTAPPAEAATK